MANLTTGQREVLKAFSEVGKPIDDIGLSVFVHHISNSDMSSSGIRTRRCELERKGLVTSKGQKQTKSGRNAIIHGLTRKGSHWAGKIV